MNGASNSSYRLLSGLGVALYETPDSENTPEYAITQIIESISSDYDPKIFSLLIGWLELYKDLVRVESLKALLRKSPIKNQKIAAAIAQRIMKKDSRWKSIIQNGTKYNLEPKIYIGNSKRLSFLDTSSLDQDFLSYNILMAYTQESPQKKYRTIQWIIKNNRWFRNRKLMGCTLRADVFTLMQDGISTPYAAAKKLSASMSAVYSNWNDLKMVIKIIPNQLYSTK